MEAATPESVGLSSSRLDRIAPVLQDYVDRDRFAGMVAMVARYGKVVYSECFGTMDREAGRPVQPDTLFRIYSMSKPITSVALMMLYEEGRFQLSDPVSRFIPEFGQMQVLVEEANGTTKLVDQLKEATIRDLLTHMAGLTYGLFEGDSAVELLYRQARLLDTNETLATWIARLTTLPLAFQPGAAWRYSVATDVLGYLVEVISGMRFDVFLEQRIFQPLGMVDTGFSVPEEQLHRFAAMYGPAQAGGLELIDAPATSKWAKPLRFLSGGGGLVSTATDYMRFSQMLLNGGELEDVRLLGFKTVELMTTNHLPDRFLPYHTGPQPAYGYGFGLGFRVLLDVAESGILGSEGEFGWGGAAGTYFWVDPQEELIGLIMPQLLLLSGGYYPLAQDFRVLTYQAIVD